MQEDDEGGVKMEEDDAKTPTLRTPVLELKGHTSVVSSSDFMPAGDQIITASWDRTACLFDLETGDLLLSLGGES